MERRYPAQPRGKRDIALRPNLELTCRRGANAPWLGGSHGAHPRAAYFRSSVTETMVSRPRYESNLEPRACGEASC
eukprot:8853835-Alexandrium_andersonii.AAC.1